MDDYFDYHPELEERLIRSGKECELKLVHESADLANIFYVRQKETKGLGHAIWRAKRFVGDEPFAVLLGDDVMRSKTPVLRQLIDAAEKYECPAVGTQEVPSDQVCKYSSIKVSPLEPNIFRVHDMNEKPSQTEKFSNYAILGRYVLTPEIFDVLETTAPGHGGEIQLTDGLRVLARGGMMCAVDFEGRRFDTGNLRGFLEATLEYGLESPDVGSWLREYILTRAKTL
jgi:UTP--glucose-1-phosphate uridylyltransferase